MPGKKSYSLFLDVLSTVTGLVGNLWSVDIGWWLEDSNLRCFYPKFNTSKGAKREPCMGTVGEDTEKKACERLIDFGV